jgi:hypothetical protein
VNIPHATEGRKNITLHTFENVEVNKILLESGAGRRLNLKRLVTWMPAPEIIPPDLIAH